VKSRKSDNLTVKKSFFLALFSLIFLFNLWAVNFNGLNISFDDRLLFKAEFEEQYELYISRLTDMSIQQLTVFPEKMYLVDNGRTIITLSRFGAVRIPVSGGLPTPIKGYPSLIDGNVPLKGRLQDVVASADGRWILHIEPVSPGYGNLLLIETSGSVKRIISERIELPGADFPVKWSPDSRLFVYEKGGRLFYFPIIEDLSVLIDERFRMIGQGGINSVLWGQQGDFFYLCENVLYRVTNPELFTRTIYGDFLSIGAVVGVFPFNFDSGFDRYWIAPDSRSILINKGQKSLFYFRLGESRIDSVPSAPAFLPHITIPYGSEKFNILWSSSGLLTVLYSLQDQITAMRFDINSNTIRALPRPISANGALSPDGTRAAIWGENGLELWDYENWRLIQRISREEVFSFAWLNNNLLIIGTSNFIEEINISSPTYQRRRIILCAADEYGFEESLMWQSRIYAKVGNEWFISDGRSAWTSAANVQTRQVSFSSDRFRVFLENQVTGPYKNNIYIRNLQSTGTVSLFSGQTAGSIYTQANQTQIALCFDLYDDDTGLLQVLAALRRFNIRATFFLNGEFIRRNPLAASAIAEAGHETASMFYAPIDFSDTRYRITSEFITQGLARNEDEFNRITGKELSLLWHPPYYRSSNLVNSAASSSGYVTVQRSFDPGDWISRDDALRLNLRQVPPADMIEQIIGRRESRAIIPIRLGLLPGGRDEYLYQRIDVLLDALLRSGYIIVPVSTILSR